MPEALSGDLSLISLFTAADRLVQLVIIGLVAASVWSWAIIIDKTLLFRRTNSQMSRFERVFWSGQSLEELYKSLKDRSTTGMAAVFVAAMGEWKRSFETGAKSPIGLQTRVDKVVDVTVAREMERLERRLLFLASVGLGGAFRRPFRHGLGYHGVVSGDRRRRIEFAGGGRSRHRPGVARDGCGPLRCNSRGSGLQQIVQFRGKGRSAARGVCRRIHRHLVAPGG